MFDILLVLAASYTLPHVRVNTVEGGGAVTGICFKGVSDQCVQNCVGGAESLRS